MARTTFTAEEIVELLGPQALTQLTTGGCTTQELTAAEQLAGRREPNPTEWHRNGAIIALLRWAQGDTRTWGSFRRWLAIALGDDPNELKNEEGGEAANGTAMGGVVAGGRARRVRRQITDPDQLERRKQALAKARAARAEKLADARREGEGQRADVVDMALTGIGPVGPR